MASQPETPPPEGARHHFNDRTAVSATEAAALQRYAREGYTPLAVQSVSALLAVEAAAASGRAHEVVDRSCGALVVFCPPAGAPLALVIRVRSRRKGGAARLALPKGHPEGSETDAEAALREIREETEVVVAPEELLPDVTSQTRYTYLNARRATVYFKSVTYGLALLRRGAAEPPSCGADAAWVPLAEVAERLDIPDDQRVARELAAAATARLR